MHGGRAYALFNAYTLNLRPATLAPGKSAWTADPQLATQLCVTPARLVEAASVGCYDIDAEALAVHPLPAISRTLKRHYPSFDVTAWTAAYTATMDRGLLPPRRPRRDTLRRHQPTHTKRKRGVRAGAPDASTTTVLPPAIAEPYLANIALRHVDDELTRKRCAEQCIHTVATRERSRSNPALALHLTRLGDRRKETECSSVVYYALSPSK